MLKNSTSEKPNFLDQISEYLQTAKQDITFIKEQINPDLLQDYLKFKALLTYEKTNKNLENLTHNPSEHELNAEKELYSDDEEEDKNTESVSGPEQTSSFSSKRNSSINMSFFSKRNSFMPQSRRFGSFLTEYSKNVDETKANRRISFLDFQPFNIPKKRNSDIIGTVPNNILFGKYNSRKSMFEMIKRASLKVNLDISSINTDISPEKVKISAFALSGNTRSSQSPIEIEEQRKKSSLLIQPFNSFIPASDIESEDETDSECSDEDESNNIDQNPTSLESFFKIAITQYNEYVFKSSCPWSDVTEAEINKRNMLEISQERLPQKNNSIDGLIHESEIIRKKFQIKEFGIVKNSPFYIVDMNGFTKAKMNKRNKKIILQRNHILEKNSYTKNDCIAEVHSFSNIEPNYLQSRYSLFLSNDLQNNKTQEVYTLTTYNNNVFSHIIPRDILNNCGFDKNFQIMFDHASQRYPINMLPIVELQYPSKARKFNLTSSIISNISSFLRNDRILIRDDFSKRGTFVNIPIGNPIALKEGNLFMLNEKIGFYIKRISNQKIVEDSNLQDLNSAYDFVCLNSRKIDTDFCNLILGYANMGLENTDEKKIAESHRSEYQTILQTENIPHILLELVKWNDKFKCYEEKGGIFMLYNSKEYVNSPTEKLYYLSHNSKNWVDLCQDCKVLKKLNSNLTEPLKMILGFDKSENIWFMETYQDLQEIQYQEILIRESYFTNNDYYFDYLSISEGRNLNQGKIVKSLNFDSNGSPNTFGPWMSISNFSIFQDQFNGGWVQVSSDTLVLFGTTIIELKLEKFYT